MVQSSDGPKTTKTGQEHDEKSCKIAPMTDWFVRDYGGKLKDENQTFLAIKTRANTLNAKNPWYQISSSSNVNVTLLHFLQFNQVSAFNKPIVLVFYTIFKKLEVKIISLFSHFLV